MVIGVKKTTILFLLGAIGYCGLELLSRGYTHWSMGLTGGVCFVALWYIWQKSRRSVITKAVFGATIITFAELCVGILVNVWLELSVWSYVDEPFNFMGQICVKYFVVWFFLCIAVMSTFDIITFARIRRSEK